MRTEKVFAILWFVALVLKFCGVFGTGIALVLMSIVLSLLYLVGGFYFFSDKSLKQQNLALSIIAGIFLSASPLAFLFKLQYWTGGTPMFIFAIAGAAIILLSAIFISKFYGTDNLHTYYRRMIIRSGILLIIGLVLFFTPSSTLINLQYRNDPQKAKALIDYCAPSENK